ncbi:MAG TPA: hypothetical protein VEW07_04440 [Solirubrobacterales bacterium]|nr:hypothetical protein [Solirubrobacterales bacterium]
MTQEATDPALIAAISGGAAILGGLVGGGLGYRGVAKQMKEQRQLEHLQNRREAYLSFLDLAQRFMLGSGPLRYDKSEWIAFAPKYEHRLLAIKLVGLPDVVTAAEKVEEAFTEMMLGVEYSEDTPAEESRRQALKAHEETIQLALAELSTAMRKDVGPS